MIESQELRSALLRAVIMLVIAVTSAHSACRGGSDWIEYGGHCYFWYRSNLNWFYSELACKRMGGGLVSIHSQSESSFLLRLTQCSSAFWIGLVNIWPQARLDRNYGYAWWDSDSFLRYNTLNLTGAPYTDCVFSDSKGQWFNTHCQNSINSVCKAPAVQASSGEHQTELESAEVAEAALQNATDEWVTSFTADGATPSPIPRATGSPSRCPEGWVQLDNNCYFHSRNRTNYFNAQMSCQAMAATVTSVLTRREHTLLTVAVGCDSQTWIGLEKARPCFRQPGRDHCWVWMDRSPVGYTDWAPGQQLDRRDAECVMLDGGWKVANCYSEYVYLCKRSA